MVQAQAIFFTPAKLSTQDAFKWMGVMAVGIACFQLLLWFPPWGGLLFPPKKGATEEDYYFSGASCSPLACSTLRMSMLAWGRGCSNCNPVMSTMPCKTALPSPHHFPTWDNRLLPMH